MKCDICGSDKNVKMYMDGVDGINRVSETTIRLAIESITSKKISFMPHLCDDCFRKYDFAGKLKHK